MSRPIRNPYGIKPLGNAFLVTDKRILQVRKAGLGRLCRLSDEAILEVIGFLNGIELAYVGMLSRMMYIFSMTSDIWRDLSLKLPGDNIEFCNTWRDTYVNKFLVLNGKPCHSLLLHSPIVVEGAFSNILHRMWACRNCDLSLACPGFYSPDTVCRRHASTLSVDQFVDEFEIPNKPVIIEGAADHWPAFQKWTKEYLNEMCDSTVFRATSATAPQAASFTMRQYFHYADATTEEVPLYLFDRNIFDDVPALSDDFEVPKYFSQSGAHGTDLFRLFGASRRPDYRWLIVGPARSGSVFHIDPNSTNAWNISIRGRKKWIFYPPGISPPGVLASPDGADVTVPLSTAEWLLSFWSEHLEALKYWPEHAKPTEAIANPGDLVFVPHGYWHMVVNLDDCIAITQNYVSTSNLKNVLHFLRDKPDQISGITDRTGEAIDPDNMWNEFCTFLENADDKSIPKHQVIATIEELRSGETSNEQSTQKRVVDTNGNNVNRRKFSSAVLRKRLASQKRKSKVFGLVLNDDDAIAATNSKRLKGSQYTGNQEQDPSARSQPSTFSFGFNL